MLNITEKDLLFKYNINERNQNNSYKTACFFLWLYEGFNKRTKNYLESKYNNINNSCINNYLNQNNLKNEIKKVNNDNHINEEIAMIWFTRYRWYKFWKSKEYSNTEADIKITPYLSGNSRWRQSISTN